MSEAPTPSESALPLIAGYRLQRRLGSGGMAEVFLAEQISLSRQVAIKVLTTVRESSADLSVRFEREARTIARLEHPDIVGIYDVGRTGDGRLYYAMPHLPKGDLSQRDLRGRPQELLAVLRHVCHAIEYAHSQGVVHRDIKPENILFDASDNPRLADFGIAISSEHDQRMTMEGRTLGSSGYMSPEQARGLRLDGRADLYSLGVVLFELLTGDVPFHGPDSLSVALKHTQDPIPRLGTGLRHWQPVIDKALAKQPAQRFQTAREMLLAIEEAAQSERAANTTDMYAVAPARRGWRGSQSLPVTIGASIALLGSMGWLAWTLLRGMPDEAPDYFVASAPAAAEVAPQVPREEDTALVVKGAALSDEERERLLAEALGLIQQERLFQPDAGNAAAKLRTLVADKDADPGVEAAIAQLLSVVATRLDTAAAAAEWSEAAELFVAADAFATDTGNENAPAWQQLESQLVAAVAAPLEVALAAEDKAALPPLRAVVAALGERHGELQRMFDRISVFPDAGESMRDTGGPELVYVPARSGESQIEAGFAMMRDEVTVGEFDAFVRATSRPPSVCKGETGLRSILARADWRKPGFEQDSRHPVVCVSYNDAVAFANWLSARVRSRYRLPTAAEWKHAATTLAASGTVCVDGNVLDSGSLGKTIFSGKARTAHTCSDAARFTAPVGAYAQSAVGLRDLGGNVAEWTASCAGGGEGSGESCARRVAIGRSFRSGTAESPVDHSTAQESAAGAVSTGFRLVREVGVR